jgi:hypothetical protein
MTEDDDFGPPLMEESDAGLDTIEDSLENVLEEDSEPPTLKEWKAMDVENSPIAFVNRFLHGGPVEGFDRLIVQNEPERELPKEDLDPDRDFKTDFRSVVWTLLLKEARNLPSDEKLEFYLKTNPEAAELIGFDGPDDTPEKTTFWRAHSSEEPRISVEAMDTLKPKPGRPSTIPSTSASSCSRRPRNTSSNSGKTISWMTRKPSHSGY